MAASWLSLDIPAFWKQFTIVSGVSASQAETNICIPWRIEIFGRVLFFSRLPMTLQTTFLRYFAFNERITPWSIGWVCEVMLGGRKNNLIAFKFSMCGWAGQLSITKATLFSSQANFRSSSLTHSSNNTPSVQLFRWLLYRQGRNLTFLKHRGFLAFPLTNIGNFSPDSICCCHASEPYFT